MGNNPSAANRLAKYCKPLTISPALLYFRKRFLMDLYRGAYIRGWANTWLIFCVSIKQVRHKQVSHKQENKHDNML